jgi:hypothetical protein
MRGRGGLHAGSKAGDCAAPACHSLAANSGSTSFHTTPPKYCSPGTPRTYRHVLWGIRSLFTGWLPPCGATLQGNTAERPPCQWLDETPKAQARQARRTRRFRVSRTQNTLLLKPNTTKSTTRGDQGTCQGRPRQSPGRPFAGKQAAPAHILPPQATSRQHQAGSLWQPVAEHAARSSKEQQKGACGTLTSPLTPLGPVNAHTQVWGPPATAEERAKASLGVTQGPFA